VTPQTAREVYGLRVQQYVHGRRNAQAETHVKYCVYCPRTFVRAESPWGLADLRGTLLDNAVRTVVAARERRSNR
jgi:hypothetical protein